MQRYFNDSVEDVYKLSKEDSYHILKVMRLKIGDNVEIVNKSKLRLAEIIDISNNMVTVREKIQIDNGDSTPLNVTIAQALVKEQKMDYILQKSCELGVSKIIPLSLTRCVIKLDDGVKKKIERWKKIVKEASEQSKRLTIPTVTEPYDIKELLNLDYDVKLLCTVNEKSMSIKKVLSNINISDTILFVVGPEGGFTKEEEELLTQGGFVSITLGNLVMRSETVSLFIMSVINYRFMG